MYNDGIANEFEEAKELRHLARFLARFGSRNNRG